jgi:hypothetical protein
VPNRIRTWTAEIPVGLKKAIGLAWTVADQADQSERPLADLIGLRPCGPPGGGTKTSEYACGCAVAHRRFLSGFARLKWRAVIVARGVRSPRRRIAVAGLMLVLLGSLLAPADAAAVPRMTMTMVSCSPDPVKIGQPTTCTATVSDMDVGTQSPPQGTVSWMGADGSFTGSPCTLADTGPATSACSVTFTPTMTTGSHMMTANYMGNMTHMGGSGSGTVTATKRSTSTSLSCLPASVALNEGSNCTATVSDNDTGTQTAPQNTVMFGSSGMGGFSMMSCTVTGSGPGPSSCSTTWTPTGVGSGTHTITANYAGDMTHDMSMGSGDVTVHKRSTSTVVSCSPSSLGLNQPTTCTATVTDTDAGTKSAPMSTVNFSSDRSGGGTFSSPSCTLSMPGAATASCSVTYTPSVEGDHKITGDYTQDMTHEVSSGSNTVSVPKRPTSTAVSCVPDSRTVGQSATCTATVSDTGSGTKSDPAQSVNFSSDGSGSFSSPSCAPAGSGSGSAACSVTYTPSAMGSGTHKVTASYGGDAVHSASAASTNVTVSALPPTSGGSHPSGGGTGGTQPNGGSPRPCSGLTSLATAYCGASQRYNAALRACSRVRAKKRTACARAATRAYLRALARARCQKLKGKKRRACFNNAPKG